MNQPINTKSLTRVGPGTPMGDFMREYWVPALMSSELLADREPVRLMLLGERLIAFRDSGGKVGILDERCPHRGVSLFLGRNEEHGIRCIYHGWKFGADGECLDMPSLPPEQDCKHLMKAKAYPTLERAGVIWAYMGKRATPPAFPSIEAAMLDDAEANVYCLQRQCNWLQIAEGDLDTSHFGFLHLGCVEADDFPDDNPLRYSAAERAPIFSSSETEWGTSYGAHRQAGADENYWRVANFMFPFWTQSPQGDFSDHIDARAFVPMDDEHTMMFHISWKKKSLPLRVEGKNGKPIPGLKNNNELQPNTNDWFGRWRTVATPENIWTMDREMQRTGVTYSGIDNLRVQDQAVVESMGPIVDHDLEHFVPSDQMVAKTRRRLVKALSDYIKKGIAPPGVDDPDVFYKARSGFFVADAAVMWPEIYAQQMAHIQRPVEAVDA